MGQERWNWLVGYYVNSNRARPGGDVFGDLGNVKQKILKMC